MLTQIRLFKTLTPFHATDLFWYPQEASENQRFSDVFRGYQKKSVTWNGLIGKLCLKKFHLREIQGRALLYV